MGAQDEVHRKTRPLRHGLIRGEARIRVEAHIAAIHRTAHSVTLADGRTLPYGHLVLALGARNRVPAVPGITLWLPKLLF